MLWEDLISSFSRTCEATSRTHIAFLGTAILAKATHLEVDVFAVKAKAATSGAYSARGLGHGVLVPLAPKIGIDLGVTGREPLNNQPYFRIRRATWESMESLVRESTPILELNDMLEKLAQISSEEEARSVLRAFISVRRGYLPSYSTAPSDPDIERLIVGFADIADAFVASMSEGGKRAQGVAAGILGAVFGSDNVESSRVNDPDRHLPGDVGVRDEAGSHWRLVLEVRDKPVSNADVLLLAHKAAQEEVSRVACLAIASTQQDLDSSEARRWALAHGVVVIVFTSWHSFIDACLFWGSEAKSPGLLIAEAVQTVYEQLKELEVSVEGVSAWIGQTEAAEDGT